MKGPTMIQHEGTTYLATGKTGTNVATGLPAAEFEAEAGGARVWRLEDGLVVDE